MSLHSFIMLYFHFKYSKDHLFYLYCILAISPFLFYFMLLFFEYVKHSMISKVRIYKKAYAVVLHRFLLMRKIQFLVFLLFTLFSPTPCSYLVSLVLIYYFVCLFAQTSICLCVIFVFPFLYIYIKSVLCL